VFYKNTTNGSGTRNLFNGELGTYPDVYWVTRTGGLTGGQFGPMLSYTDSEGTDYIWINLRGNTGSAGGADTIISFSGTAVPVSTLTATLVKMFVNGSVIELLLSATSTSLSVINYTVNTGGNYRSSRYAFAPSTGWIASATATYNLTITEACAGWEAYMAPGVMLNGGRLPTIHISAASLRMSNVASPAWREGSVMGVLGEPDRGWESYFYDVGGQPLPSPFSVLTSDRYGAYRLPDITRGANIPLPPADRSQVNFVEIFNMVNVSGNGSQSGAFATVGSPSSIPLEGPESYYRFAIILCKLAAASTSFPNRDGYFTWDFHYIARTADQLTPQSCSNVRPVIYDEVCYELQRMPIEELVTENPSHFLEQLVNGIGQAAKVTGAIAGIAAPFAAIIPGGQPFLPGIMAVAHGSQMVGGSAELIGGLMGSGEQRQQQVSMAMTPELRHSMQTYPEVYRDMGPVAGGSSQANSEAAWKRAAALSGSSGVRLAARG